MLNPPNIRSVAGAAIRPDRIDARDIAQKSRRLRHAPIGGADVHRALLAQRLKSRVHLRGNGTREGPGRPWPGKSASGAFSGIFANRQRIPDLGLTVDEQRHTL
jgi:hypothetical protein